ncbi:hypothetical protein MASR1M66_11680 [Aminivibrio sp.]
MSSDDALVLNILQQVNVFLKRWASRDADKEVCPVVRAQIAQSGLKNPRGVQGGVAHSERGVLGGISQQSQAIVDLFFKG